MRHRDEFDPVSLSSQINKISGAPNVSALCEVMFLKGF